MENRGLCGCLLALLLLSAVPCFGQDEEQVVEISVSELNSWKMRLLEVLNEKESLEKKLKSQEELLSTLEAGFSMFEAWSISFRKMLTQHLDDLAQKLNALEERSIVLQDLIGRVENYLEESEQAWKRLSNLSTDILKAHRRTLIKAVVITGSVTLGIGAITVVLVLIFG